ncbi:MAG: hypothetical protein ACRDDE_05860 [Paraclostridium sp.]|uniref:hypothetical protein n=1 Tax=Paraclostridium sp. TaxID=2023273 RepID=UPI003EE793FE
MDSLVRIKEILQTQIDVTQDMFNRAIEKEVSDKEENYISFYTEGLKNKIEAWEQTLEFVNTEIEKAERELEELEIFKTNTHETYYG